MFFSLVQPQFAGDDDQVTEETALNPDSEGGKQLTIVEGLCMATVILKPQYRFGVLIGEEESDSVLAGRENLENPDAPINLIHQTDCIGIILK
jgi:hypothetical protein